MNLPRLSCSDLQRAIRIVLAYVVHSKPLLCRAEATWHAHADHETERRLDSHLLALIAQISVVLLIAPMEFDNLGILERHLPCANVIQCRAQCPSQLIGFTLDHLVRLHRTVVVAASGIGLVDSQARKKLS